MCVEVYGLITIWTIAIIFNVCDSVYRMKQNQESYHINSLLDYLLGKE